MKTTVSRGLLFLSSPPVTGVPFGPLELLCFGVLPFLFVFHFDEGTDEVEYRSGSRMLHFLPVGLQAVAFPLP